MLRALSLSRSSLFPCVDGACRLVFLCWLLLWPYGSPRCHAPREGCSSSRARTRSPLGRGPLLSGSGPDRIRLGLGIRRIELPACAFSESELGHCTPFLFPASLRSSTHRRVTLSRSGGLAERPAFPADQQFRRHDVFRSASV